MDSTQAGDAPRLVPPRSGNGGDGRETSFCCGGDEQSAQKSKGRGGSKVKGHKDLEGRRRMRKESRVQRHGPLIKPNQSGVPRNRRWKSSDPHALS